MTEPPRIRKTDRASSHEHTSVRGVVLLWGLGAIIITACMAVGFWAGYRYRESEQRIERIEKRFDQMTVPELRTESKERGLPVYRDNGQRLKRDDYIDQLRKSERDRP